MVGPLLGLGLGLALLLAIVATPDEVAHREGLVTLAPGVWVKPGVALTPPQRAWLLALRELVPPRLPIVVTSGYRSTADQAAALWAKRQAGSDLRLLYRSGSGPAIATELNAAVSKDHMERILSRWEAAGVVLSRHQLGDALDLRVRGLPAEAVSQLAWAARALGAEVLLETRPPHLHVEGLA